MIWDFLVISKYVNIKKGWTVQDLVNVLKAPEMLTIIGIHAQALISNSKPILNHKNPRNTIRKANK